MPLVSSLTWIPGTVIICFWSLFSLQVVVNDGRLDIEGTVVDKYYLIAFGANDFNDIFVFQDITLEVDLFPTVQTRDFYIIVVIQISFRVKFFAQLEEVIVNTST